MASKKKLKKDEIAHTVHEAIGIALEKLNITKASKKTEKVVDKVSKKFSDQLEKEVKKQEKKVAQAEKKVEKEKLALEKKTKVKK